MLMVNTVGDDDLIITITPDEALKDWITLEPSAELTLPANSRRELWAIIQLPDDVELGNYTGTITVQAAPVSKAKKGEALTASVEVAAAIPIATTIEVTDKEIVSYVVRALTVKDAEVGGKIPFSITVQNTGNVKVTPKIHIDVLDRAKAGTLKSIEFAQVELMPTITTAIKISMPSGGLDVGKYWAELTPEFGGKQLSSFNIREEGGLAMKGKLRQVASPVWVATGEIVEVSALFENTGEKITSAKFEGGAYLIDEVYEREKLVELIESNVIDVGTDESTNMTAYFTPTEPGRYSVRGVVVYANKRTSEKGTIVNVLARPTITEPVAVEIRPNYALYLILAVLMFIALGVWKIAKKKTPV